MKKTCLVRSRELSGLATSNSHKPCSKPRWQDVLDKVQKSRLVFIHSNGGVHRSLAARPQSISILRVMPKVHMNETCVGPLILQQQSRYAARSWPPLAT